MCGISGFTGTPNAQALSRMLDALRHRGPDGAGQWYDGRISLGMRRLAIVDLDGGQQPVANETGSVRAVFNGEIYNHKSLRDDLVRKGHCFQSDHSDSEVLVHLYEEHGPAFLNELNGMFAMALWDERNGTLLLARDRMGIKPLYFALVNGQLLFASEERALFAHGVLRKEPDFQALHHYFSFKHIAAPQSAFRGVQQLLPGEMALFADGVLSRRAWWRLSYDERPVTDIAAHARELLTLLRDSTRLQLQADVEVGAFLSGGLDSSTVVALASEFTTRPLKTFTLCYEDQLAGKAADRAFARRVATQFGTEHYEHVVTADDVRRQLPAALQGFDGPFAGVISTYYLSSLIARHVKTAVSGDGADELFGSYLAHRVAPLFARMDVRGVHAEFNTAEADDARLAASLLSRSDDAARRMGLYVFDDAGKQSLYSERMRALVQGVTTEKQVRAWYAQAGTTDPVNRALYVDAVSLLPDQVLAFSDRLAMQHSLEVRPMFLDHRIVEWAARVPGEWKLRNGQVKYLLKEAVRGLLPDEVIDRPKEGFLMPMTQWLLTVLQDWARDTLTKDRLRSHGLLNPEAVGRLLNDFFAGQRALGAQIWTLLMFQLWWERHFV